jgi:hypothetical protein
MPGQAQGCVFNNAEGDNARQAPSLYLPSSSGIQQSEYSEKGRLKLAGLKLDPFRASPENRPVPKLSDNSLSLQEECSPAMKGVFEKSETALLSTESLSLSAQTMPGSSLDHFSFNGMISPLGACSINYDRSLFGGSDRLMAMETAPCEDQYCRKSDQSVDGGDQVSGADIKKNWAGLGRDTAYFVGYQFLVIGVVYVMPEDMSSWTKEQKKDYDLDRWLKNVKHPAWDNDKWYINYLIHPYWGATYYIRARERGFDKLESFIYSTVLSAMYEFGAEALFEQPSYQDLIFTPVGGTLLGMYVFEPLRDKIKARGPDGKWYDNLALILSDPLGTVSEITDKLLGVKSSVRITHHSPGKQRCRAVEGDFRGLERAMGSISCSSSYTGLEMAVRW